jgi:hypothetical protein
MKQSKPFSKLWAHLDNSEVDRRRANLESHFKNTKNKLKCDKSVLNTLGALEMKDGKTEAALSYWDLVFQIEKNVSSSWNLVDISPESRDPRTAASRLLEIANADTLDASKLGDIDKSVKAKTRWAEIHNLSTNPSTPLEVLTTIAKFEGTRSFFGENISCTSELIWKSATNGEVADALSNPAAPLDLLEEVFISSRNFWEHKLIARNLATPADDYFLVYAGLKSSEEATGIEMKFGYKIQMELIENPCLPDIVIEALSKTTNSRLLKKIETWKSMNLS